jgi:hypothetical protein
MFERLAIYGNRSSFIKSLGQATNTFDPYGYDTKPSPSIDNDVENIPPPSPETATAPVVNRPKETIPTVPVESLKPVSTGPSIDPTSLEGIQLYLNKAMPQLPSLVPDGKWGPLTAKMLIEWGKARKLNLTIQQLLDLAKTKSMADDVSNQIHTGPNYNTSGKSPSGFNPQDQGGDEDNPY